jgi:hypothetical protein
MGIAANALCKFPLGLILDRYSRLSLRSTCQKVFIHVVIRYLTVMLSRFTPDKHGKQHSDWLNSQFASVFLPMTLETSGCDIAPISKAFLRLLMRACIPAFTHYQNSFMYRP